MTFLEAQAVRAVLLLTLAAVVFTGVAFAGYAACLALLPYMSPAIAAAIVAVVLLAIAFGAAFAVRARVQRPAEPPREQQNSEAATVALIAGMAKEKPLLAVLFAGLLGAAGTIVQQKKRVD